MTSVLPIDFSGIDVPEGVLSLLAREAEEFEAVLGRPVELRPAHVGEPAWTTRPRGESPSPELHRTVDGGLVSVADTTQELLATVNLLHALWRGDADLVRSTPAASVDEAIARVRAEIAATYPYFGLRGLDWDEICDRHLESVPDEAGFADFAAAWIAELGDAHTTIRVRGAGSSQPPCRAELTETGARLLTVPTDSAAFQAGVRVGWTIRIDDAERWRRIAGASPQQLRQVQARRALAFEGSRAFRAVSPSGARQVEWVETAPTGPARSVVTRRPGCALWQIPAFADKEDLHGALDELIGDASPDDALTIDLRGNTGGDLLLALELRDRFLRERTRIGSIRFTDGRGGLGPSRERWAEPSDRPRWPGRVEILIDEMTYSASEDFVLGLQGLDHVTVRGRPSGGGSGRPRLVPILDGIQLRVSTAITYDRAGNPVERRGIVPDREL